MDLDTKARKEELELAREKATTINELLALIPKIQKVIDVETKESNYRGVVDALGHKKLIYSKASFLNPSNPEYLQKELETAKMALDVAKNNKTENYPIAIIHYCGAVIDQQSKKDSVDNKLLSDSLNEVSIAMRNFPGSKAHLAWPSLSKARLEILLNKLDEAEDSLCYGIRSLSAGYEEETKNPNGLLKLKVWLSGLQLGFALLCKKRNQPELAKMWASTVINTDDPEGQLSTRKQQAKDLLSRL